MKYKLNTAKDVVGITDTSQPESTSTDLSAKGTRSTTAVSHHRIVTIPNVISVTRILCIPWFCWLLFGAENRWYAALLLGTLGATDWVDGWWARRFNAVSELGKLLDPVTDRIVFIVSTLTIGLDGAVPWWLIISVLTRDVLISLGGVTLGILGVKQVDVTWWGKCATFGLYSTFPLLLAGTSHISAASVLHLTGWLFAIPSLILSYFSAFLYIPLGMKALRKSRSDD